MNVEDLNLEELKNLRETFVKEYKESIEKKRASLTPEELDSRKRAIARQLKMAGSTTDLLGDINDDPNFVYRWHTMIKDSDIKLARRMDLGYTLAPKEDMTRLKIGSSSTYGKVNGTSAVIANHGNCSAVLLRMPREQAELNQQLRDELLVQERKQKVISSSPTKVVELDDYGTTIYGK